LLRSHPEKPGKIKGECEYLAMSEGGAMEQVTQKGKRKRMPVGQYTKETQKETRRNGMK